MGFLGDLFAGDPASKWVREPQLNLEIDLEQLSLCGVRLGSRPAALSKLGRPTNPKPTRAGCYSWAGLGIDAFASNDVLHGYSIDLNLKEFNPGVTPYAGAVLLGGKPLPLGIASRREDVVRLLGEPWHEFSDEEDPELSRTLFYVTRTREWNFGFLASGTLGLLEISSPPTLAEPQSRKHLKCEKPWPP